MAYIIVRAYQRIDLHVGAYVKVKGVQRMANPQRGV